MAPENKRPEIPPTRSLIPAPERMRGKTLLRRPTNDPALRAVLRHILQDCSDRIHDWEAHNYRGKGYPAPEYLREHENPLRPVLSDEQAHRMQVRIEMVDALLKRFEIDLHQIADDIASQYAI